MVKTVDEAANTGLAAIMPTPKRCALTTIVLGILVVVGVGGTGILGLLHSHKIISLPLGLAPIGNLNASYLWLMTGGGALLGVALIGYGSCKIHKAKAPDKQAQVTFNEDQLMQAFGDNFTKDLVVSDFIAMPQMYFTSVSFPDDPQKNMYLVKKDSSCKLECTRPVFPRTTLPELLKKRGYQEAPDEMYTQMEKAREERLTLEKANFSNKPPEDVATYHIMPPVKNNTYAVESRSHSDPKNGMYTIMKRDHNGVLQYSSKVDFLTSLNLIKILEGQGYRLSQLRKC